MSNSYINKYKLNENDEINFNLLFNFLLRNKKFITICSLISFFLASFSSLFLKKTWVGQFEIVLDENISTPLPSGLPEDFEISEFLDLGNTKNLKTEVGILESPSVLMPIFEFVESKNKKKSFFQRDLTFDDWKKKNLKINLKKSTSILKITYKDENKDLVIPVLDKISNKYQQYTDRSSIRSNELLKRFLKDQVDLYKAKSSKSLKAVQSFAIDQDLLGIISTAPNSNSSENENSKDDKVFLKNIRIEQVRVNAANKIRDIDLQIEKINSIGNDIEKLQYIGSTIPGLNNEGLPARLKKIEQDLSFLQTKYSKNDISVKKILEERLILIDLLKKRSIGYLQAERLMTESIMEAATRPKETLLMYKELIRKANRDESTLIDLENKLRMIEIQDSMLRDPWELITTPTLDDEPQSISKFLFSFIGLIFGFMLGCLLSFIKDKKSKLILDENILISLLEKKPLLKFDEQDKYFNPENFQVTIEDITKDLNSINLVFTSNFDEVLKNKFSNFLLNYFAKINKEINIINPQESLKMNNQNNLIIISKLDNLSYQEIENLNNRINILKLNLMCILLIN